MTAPAPTGIDQRLPTPDRFTLELPVE